MKQFLHVKINKSSHIILLVLQSFVVIPNLESFQKTMSYSGSRLWNEILAEIKRSQTLDTFKDKFKQHLAAQQALAI